MTNIGPAELIVIGLLCLVWILPSYFVARYAEQQKGQNFTLFFLVGLITSFLITLLVAMVLPAKNAKSSDSLDRLERLAELRNSGALTEEEFAAQKAAILTTQQ
jgi:hypothetical protein